MTEIVNTFLEMRPNLERIISHRMHCRHTAQDLTQELYFRVLRIANELPSQSDARRYLIRMAINAANDHVRVENRRVELLMGNIGLFENYGSCPQDSALTDEQIKLVSNAMLELPKKCRDVLYLSRVEGLTHAEIAERLGVSRSMVEKYAVRAIIHCRHCLQSQDAATETKQ
ncbi:RNA polymerase sigma-70 factor, ECF subfamily/transmembrane sensor [Pseudomonas cuatrocienegasensis]|uniref:RNA polymerase sigma-70 factor, ECF subfamily/transmembrane sensor n=1 Tax=Pseudomonas cuatrocienegasensis TaxID=543360 RepID=A0ABY1B9Y9_9PSED|nr:MULTISPECIES: RNA polymerase sigma factor [Pseudomonas]SEQ34292.1 RNA polymerase sigma-70 factor, ECF subfamily/transmembrane sensor [Pseudomonas cuatrocienegasensis]